jgi:hypothetical protein
LKKDGKTKNLDTILNDLAKLNNRVKMTGKTKSAAGRTAEVKYQLTDDDVKKEVLWNNCIFSTFLAC